MTTPAATGKLFEGRPDINRSMNQLYLQSAKQHPKARRVQLEEKPTGAPEQQGATVARKTPFWEES